MQHFLKPFRLIVSIVMLAAIGFLFLDFSGVIPSAWYRGFTWLQFIPSLFKFKEMLVHGLAVTAYGFIVILVLTLLFGRVYCSYICPMGIFQDVTGWFSKKLRNIGKKKFLFRFTPPKTWLRYSILVIVCLSLLTGSIFLLNLLEPFSNFGRFCSDLFRPVYIIANNLLVKIFQFFGSYALYPVTVAKTNPYALIFPTLVLGLVIWLSVWKGRLYCNTVCPVGTLLGLVSKKSLYKIRFNASECNQCGNCMFVCKSQCIDVKNRDVDFSRCVGCGNCIKSCDKNAIRYSLASVRKLKIREETDVSKRRFVRETVLFIVALSGLSVKSFAQHQRRRRRRGENKGNFEVVASNAVAPPGSFNRHHFTRNCTACHMCVSACPSGVLKPSLFEYGFSSMMQPYMDYDLSFCNYECVRCTELCPNNAILPLTVEEKITTQIGLVRFEKQNCVVYIDDTACGSCAEHCPTKAVRMVPYKGELTIPETTPEICVGCGACEYACPVTPYKAIVVDGHLEHQKAQIPEEEELKDKPLDDFPF